MTLAFESDDRQDKAVDAVPNQGSEAVLSAVQEPYITEPDGPYIIDPHGHATVFPGPPRDIPTPYYPSPVRDRRSVKETAAPSSTDTSGGESLLTKMLKPNVPKDEVFTISMTPAGSQQARGPELETKGLVKHLENQNAKMLPLLGSEIISTSTESKFDRFITELGIEQGELDELSGQDGEARVPDVWSTSMAGPSRRAARRSRSPESPPERLTERTKRRKKSSDGQATENDVAAEAGHNEAVATEPMQRPDEGENQDCLRW